MSDINQEEISNFIVACFGLGSFSKKYENELLSVEFTLLSNQARILIDEYLTEFALESENTVSEDQLKDEEELCKMLLSLKQIVVNKQVVFVQRNRIKQDLRKIKSFLYETINIDHALRLIYKWYIEFDAYCKQLRQICTDKKFFTSYRSAYWLTNGLLKIQPNIDNSISVPLLLRLIHKLEIHNRNIEVSKVKFLADPKVKDSLKKYIANLFNDAFLEGSTVLQSTFERLKKTYLKIFGNNNDAQKTSQLQEKTS